MKSGPREGFRWTRETIAYAIDLWHREHLRTPTVNEWEAAAQNHPCRQTVIRVFGSWSAAMKASGFRPEGAASRVNRGRGAAARKADAGYPASSA